MKNFRNLIDFIWFLLHQCIIYYAFQAWVEIPVHSLLVNACYISLNIILHKLELDFPHQQKL